MKDITGWRAFRIGPPPTRGRQKVMNPLTESDLDRLEQYLTASERPESTLPLDATQGLLCAVVSAPAPVMPSRWLPAVLGEDHSFSTESEAAEITTLLLALYNDVARQLNGG